MRNILPLPELPPQIVEAINRDKLVIFLGAGVSRLVGCLGWSDLAKNLVNRCFKESKNETDQNLITFKEKSNLLAINDHRKIITICFKLLNKENKLDAFYNEVEKSLKYKEAIIAPNIYTDLAKVSARFITTNADEHFDSNFRLKEYDPFNFIKGGINKDTLYHIHGSIKYRQSLIFTLPQYFELYTSPLLKTFLAEVFNTYTVLFIGYGLTEMDLLEYLFKVDKKPIKEIKHFMLSAYYKGEENILDMEQAYYEDMNIEIIPYSKDEIGYEQLNLVIRNWVDNIIADTMQVSNRLKVIDEVVK